jgi:hypothetical protein
MRNKGALFYKLGSYAWILFALFHALSFFNDPAQLLTNDEDRRVWQLLQTHVFHIRGMAINVSSLMRGFNFYLSIFTLGTGLLNVFAVKALAADAASLKRLAAVNVFTSALLLLVTALFFHLPPLILFGLIAAAFLLSFLLNRAKGIAAKV